MGTGDQQGDDGGGGGLQVDGPTIKNLMDLKECVEDSPSFRLQLSDHEQGVGSLEVKLDKVVQSCDRMVNSGIAYMEECRTFSNSVKELASHFEKGGSVSGTLRRFHEILTELQSYYSILFDQAQRSIQSSLRSFLSGELRKVKDAKKSFDKVSDELNTAIHRNAHTPRSRPVEAEEATIVLSSVQTQFSHHAIEYAYQLNMVKAGKGHQILDNLLAFMRAQFTFFHQGYDLLREYDPFMRQVASEVDKMSKEADVVIREMDSRHNLVTAQHLPNGSPNEPLLLMDNPAVPIEMSGYLFKRASNAFKSWSRRWFILRENRIVYQSESKAEEFAVAEDLRICTVKYADDLERRFCFEVVTPIRSCMLQADSEALRKKWVAYLEAGIARALRISASNKKSEDLEEFRKRSATVSKGTPIDILRESPSLGGPGKRSDTANSNYSLGLDFLDVPGNDKCADCGSKKPKWASINLGIMLCIECSGIHRSLGVHISKVRSVTLDDWDTELQMIMCALGNARVNGIYEFEVPSHVKKPNPQSSRLVRESFIRAKYVQHAFVHPHPNFERPEIPVPPPCFPDLLTPSKSPLTASLGSSSPRSPIGKRSFSPSVKRRSPRSLSGSLRLPYRPASTSSSINPSDRSTPIDSEDDLPSRAEFSATVDPSSSSMYLLAENLKKLEKSGKLKNWGNFHLGDKLGDTIKSAKKSSKKITGYALSKLGGQGAILRRGKKSKSKEGAREVHSDTEEGDDISTSSTPLLHSMSASTHNLSIGVVPPPKPPRTFKTKFLGQPQHDQEEEEDDLLKMCEDEFSTDVLNALKQVSSVIDGDGEGEERDGEGEKRDGEREGEVDDLPYNSNTKAMANGLLSSENVCEVGVSLVKRSESSPQLTVSSTPAEELEARSSPDLLCRSSRAIGLQPIAEANSEAVDTVDGDKVVRLVSSVPLRRKVCPPAPTTFLPQSHLASCDVKASAVTEDDDEDLKKLMDDSNGRADKRLSMMSTTSAEFFSAASSEANSAAASPDFLRHGILTPPPGAPVTIISVEDGDRASEEGGDRARVMSSMSAEEEYFSTPPSSPNPVNQPDEMDVDQPDMAEVKQPDKTEVEQEDKIEVEGEDKMVDAETDLNEAVVNTVTELTSTTNTITKTTAALTTEDGEGGMTVHMTPVNKDGRKRSLTVSESMSFTVNVAGGSSRGMIKTMSKDDNFQTEYHHVFESNNTTDSGGSLVVSFSTQDLADIFNGAKSALPDATFNPLKEEPLSTEAETEVVKRDEEREKKGEGESASVADRSASPTCSSVGGSTSPEIIEPVIIPDDITPDTFLYSSVMVNDFPGVLCAIAHGANTNYINKEDESKTPILLATEANNPMMVEYLYQNGAKLTAADDHGQTLLHYAVTKDDANMVMMLLRRGVMSDIKDNEGKDPMSLAVEKENGDIVTMLRMSAFKSQAQKGSDDRQSQYMEELASEFYRDIEVASLVDPERIKRKSTTSSIEDSSSSISRDSK